MRTKPFLWLLALPIVFWQCQSSSTSTKNTNKPEQQVVTQEIQSVQKIGSDTVVASVFYQDNQQYSYAVYLPKSLEKAVKIPVILGFDSHGRGRDVIEKYKSLANRFGYLLVVSNSSKNGLSGNEITNISFGLLNDVAKRFPIDSSRVYAIGHSGGARVATGFAMQNKIIRAVVGCSAGLPMNPNQVPPYQFHYLTLCGDVDMNRNELERQQQILSHRNLEDFLIVFHGKHEWPNDSVMQYAFFLLRFNEMKDSLQPVDNKLITGFLSELKPVLNSSSMGDKVQAYRMVIYFLSGLTDVKSYEAKWKALQQSSAYAQWLKRKKTLEQEETALMQKYSTELQRHPVAWWQTTMQLFRKKIKMAEKQNDMERSAMLKRVVSYLSLASYSIVNQLIQERHWQEAEYFDAIYQLIDPQNPDVYYFAAVIAVNSSFPQDTVWNRLKTAIRYGFSDKEKLLNNPAFSFLQQQSDFWEEIEKMK